MRQSIVPNEPHTHPPLGMFYCCYCLLCIHLNVFFSYRELFRGGLPRNFVFIATFKTFSRKNAWKIFDIKDPSGDTQLALLLNKKRASIVYRDIYRMTKTVPFSKSVGELVSIFLHAEYWSILFILLLLT